MLYDLSETELQTLAKDWARALKEGRVAGFGYSRAFRQNPFFQSDPALKLSRFYDNNPALQQQPTADGVDIRPPLEIKGREKIIIFTSWSPGSIGAQLKALGLREKLDFLQAAEFLALYFWFERRQVFLQSLVFFTPMVCTLNCAECCMMLPKIVPAEKMDPEALKQDLNQIMTFVDYLQYLSLLGGEPLIYGRELAEFIDYAWTSYHGRLQNILLVTNGTVRPAPALLRVLKKSRSLVEVTDYSAAGIAGYSDRLRAVISDLEDAGLDFRLSRLISWRKIYPDHLEQRLYEDRDLPAHYARCLKEFRCPGFKAGRLYPCQMIYASERSGWPDGPPRGGNGLDLTCLDPGKPGDRQKVIRAFLGRLDGGPPALCAYCRGQDPQPEPAPAIPPGRQIPRADDKLQFRPGPGNSQWSNPGPSPDPPWATSPEAPEPE